MTSIQQAPAGNRARRNIILAVIGAAVVLLGAALGTQLFGSGAGQGPVHQLSRAVPKRSFAARLSIHTRYQACTPLPPRDGATVPRNECGEREDAAVDPNEFAAGGQSSAPDSLQASALAALIWWDEADERAMDAPIERLEKALRLTLAPVPLLVDLSAAHLLRAERTQNPRDLSEALEAARRALEHEPRNLPALFNAALAIQAMGLDGEAAEAWDAYLAVDRRSEWSDEARRRKGELITEPVEPGEPAAGAPAAEVQAFAARYPAEARELGWGPVLDGWGKAVENGDTAQAALHLRLAENLGRALEERPGGDASLMDAVRAIHAVRGDPKATMTLAQGHRAFAGGGALLREVKLEAARDTIAFVVPARTLSPVLSQWTDLSQARVLGFLGRNDAAAAALLRLLADVDSTRHPALAARARMTRGTVLARDGHYVAARAEYRAAAEHFRRAGESEHLGALQSTEGETACAQGDTVTAYRLLHRARQALRSHRWSTASHNNLHGLARCVAASGMPRAALAILDEDVRVTRLERPSIKLVDALQLRVQARGIIGDSAGAAADLDSASAELLRLPEDKEQKKWAVAVLQMAALGRVPAAKMDSAVEYLVATNVAWGLPALMRRADAKLAEGDVSGAAADLEAVITGVRELSPADAVLRAAALEQARSRFNRLVMLYLRVGKTRDALRTLEQGRVSFAPAGNGGAGGDGRLVAPAGHVALEYALIGDTLLTWVVRADTIHLVRQTVDRDEFLLTVEQTGTALESAAREAAARSGLRRLHEWLIRPVQNRLGPRHTPLVILADGEVAGVPFAALLDSGDQHLLVDHPVRYAATLADAARPRPSGGARGPALLVADPAFDPIRNPKLDRLEGARGEVDALQGLFPAAVRLDSVYATRAAFTARAQSASLIHYAGHAVFDDARPERSFLVLAGADTTGRLAAEAVRGMRLDGVRLVVLSACSTLRARGGRSGGFAGLSGALLSAGAGGVVGSLWQVSDGRAQPLMVAFHRAYQRVNDPALALRQAQLQMLASDAPLSAWAGFRYAGY